MYPYQFFCRAESAKTAVEWIKYMEKPSCSDLTLEDFTAVLSFIITLLKLELELHGLCNSKDDRKNFFL